MSNLAVIIITIHFSLVAILCLFGLHRLSMVWRWFCYRNVKALIPQPFDSLPKITVQIPLYNELFVAKRVVDIMAALDYPADKLQIQIVDDSTDQTSAIISERVAYYAQRGIHIEHVQRVQRQGYKAGALREAMDSATGEFIAIFDADFMPEPDLLLRTIDHFSDAKVGMLQFRWQHLNRNASRLTQSQAMMLDAHFGLEQQVRCASNLLFNFNGTGGIWRIEAIIDAGHWSADTLTEDLDLSYRAQLRGWKMHYLNDVTCPGELPADMNAFKSQQHRWAKGGIEVMKKMLPAVWRANIKLRCKIEATFHLSNNLAYFFMLIDTVLFLLPSLWVRQHYGMENMLWFDIPLLIMASGGHLIYLFFGQVALGRALSKAFFMLPSLMLLGIELSINNARAGVEALLGQRSEFVRTPKSGELKKTTPKSSSPSGIGLAFYQAVNPKSIVFECLLAVIYGLVLLWAVTNQQWFMLPFVMLLALGFMLTAIASFRAQYSAKS